MYDARVLPAVAYGAEAWTLTKEMEQSLEKFRKEHVTCNVQGQENKRMDGRKNEVKRHHKINQRNEMETGAHFRNGMTTDGQPKSQTRGRPNQTCHEEIDNY